MTRHHAPVAQWIERWLAEPEVRGSNPLGRTSIEMARAIGATPMALNLLTR